MVGAHLLVHEGPPALGFGQDIGNDNELRHRLAVGVADDMGRIFASLHLADGVQHHLAQDDDGLVAVAQVLPSAILDGALRLDCPRIVQREAGT